VKIVKRGTLKYPDQRELKLALFKVEDKVFRWAEVPSGTLLDGVDYLSEHDAVKGVRVAVECDPGMVGVDFTVIPVEPSPDERAAKRIYEEITIHGWEIGDLPKYLEEIATIVRQETGIEKLVETTNLYLTYRFPRLRFPKQAGLDMTEGGLVLGVIEALEITTKTDLSNLKTKLTEGIEQVKVFSNIPQGPKGVN
jgi:hypothetical protein